MALTVSTVLTMFIARERAERSIEILENRYPAVVGHDQTNTFSLGLIARKKISLLQLEVTSLHLVDLSDMEIDAGSFGKDGMTSIDQVSTLFALAESAQSAGVGRAPVEFEMKQVKRNKTSYEVYIIDFTACLLPLIDEAVLGGYSAPGVTTVYAGVFNETGLAYLYVGFRDYFPARNNTITELTVALNDEEDAYTAVKELSSLEIEGGALTLLDAPGLGTLNFHDLVKDDTVRLSFSVDRSAASYEDNLQIVRIFVDGEAEKEIANFFLTGGWVD